MGIKLVEILANGLVRETNSTAPAFESEHARLEMLGPWRQANVAASQTTTLATLGGVDADAPSQMIMPRAGTLKGVLCDLKGTITAGGATNAMTVSVMQNGTAVARLNVLFGSGSGASPNTQVDLIDDANDTTAVVAFAKGDKLTIQVASSGTLAPTTLDLVVWPLIRWAA